MKILHIADLHIGKRLGEFNLIEDQEFILSQILNIIGKHEPDCILIAGDVYDKSQPSGEAVELFDDFLTDLISYKKPIFIISGNHDSPERLSFGSRIMQKNELYIFGSLFEGNLEKVSLEDEHGRVNIYSLPFIKPAMVKKDFDEQIDTYDQAVRAVITKANIDSSKRNILLAHQFVVKGSQLPERSESEYASVGGLEYVDSSAFEAFDYVALGHLHRSQSMGSDNIRYAGSPLKYSVSEALHEKSATLIHLDEKGVCKVDKIALTPMRNLRKITGTINELIRVAKEEDATNSDYIHITLTDEGEIYDALGQLRLVYPNILGLDFKNSRTEQGASAEIAATNEVATKSPIDLFASFYQIQNNNELTLEQIEVMKTIFEQAGGEDL